MTDLRPDNLLFTHNNQILWMGFKTDAELVHKTRLDEIYQDVSTVVRPLRFNDRNFLSLQECMFVLNDVLYWIPSAFDDHSQYVLETWFKNRYILNIDSTSSSLLCM